MVGQSLLPGRTLSTADQLWVTPPWSASPPSGFERPANATSMDFPLAFEPWHELVKDQLPGAPLWNPYAMAGRPLLGNGQSAAFSPFTVAAIALPDRVATGVIAGLKLFISALGAFVLARSLGQFWAGATLAGLVYGFGLPIVTWLLIEPNSSAWVLMPWVMLAADGLRAHVTAPKVALLAALVALVFFTGQPEAVFHVLAVAGLFFTFRLVTAGGAPGRGPRSWWAPAAGFGGAILWGAVLAAVAILPFAELLSVFFSSDVTDRGAIVHRSLDRRYVAALGLPFYWGREGGVLPQARFLYVGALPVMLAILALLRPTVPRVIAAATGATCLLVAFAVPPAYQVANALPGFQHVDNTRTMFVFALCVGLLAGAGLQDILERRHTGLRAWSAPVAGFAVLCVPLLLVAGEWPSTAGLRDGLAVAWKARDPSGLEVLRLASIVHWLTFGALAIALLVVLVRRTLPARSRWVRRWRL